LQGDLLKPLQAVGISPTVLLCNLPYVPDSHTINEAAMQEPKVAIFGGADGLDLYRALCGQLAMFSTKPQYILTESLPGQHEALQILFNTSGYRQASAKDFIQVFTLR
jgi:release factor glutamine methyltransferase